MDTRLPVTGVSLAVPERAEAGGVPAPPPTSAESSKPRSSQTRSPGALLSNLTPIRRTRTSHVLSSADESRRQTDGLRTAARTLTTPSAHASSPRNRDIELSQPEAVVEDDQLREAVLDAALHGDSERLQALIAGSPGLLSQKKACIDAYGPDGRSPLLVAARAGHHEVVGLLAQAGADLYSTIHGDPRLRGVNAVYLAAQQGHRAVIERLAEIMKRRAAPKADMASYFDARLVQGFTPLLAAVHRPGVDDAQMVRLLISLGADPRHSRDGWTYPVHIAAKLGKTATLQALLEASENDAGLLGARDVYGKTPVLLAAEGNHLEAAKILLALGADGAGALIEATQNNHARAIETLLAAMDCSGRKDSNATLDTSHCAAARPAPQDASAIEGISNQEAGSRRPSHRTRRVGGLSLRLPPNVELFLQRSADADRGLVSRAPVVVSETKRIILMPSLVYQNGHICKLAALANLDLLYATERGIANIPLRKNRSGYYTSQVNHHHSGVANTSIRETAKKYDSRQGEILQVSDLQSVAHEMGYQVTTLRPLTIDECRTTIAQHIEHGTPLLTFFQVSKREGPARHGWPRSGGTETTEHAALVVGIDTGEDTVDLAHWGQVFPRIPLSDLFGSMDALADVRKPEVYERTALVRDERARNTYKKYDIANEPPSDIQAGVAAGTIRPSVVPTKEGFRNMLLVVEPDESHQRWKSGRTAASRTEMPETALESS